MDYTFQYQDSLQTKNETIAKTNDQLLLENQELVAKKQQLIDECTILRQKFIKKLNGYSAQLDELSPNIVHFKCKERLSQIIETSKQNIELGITYLQQNVYSKHAQEVTDIDTKSQILIYILQHFNEELIEFHLKDSQFINDGDL